MWTSSRIAVAILATTFVPFLGAESRCPGNAVSLRYSLVNGHQLTVAVSINQSGPFSFLLDTGSQITVLDPILAAQLDLGAEGQASVVNAGFSSSGFFSQVAAVEAGTLSVSDLKVLVSDLGHLRARGIEVQGILGEDFLDRFDLLIDNHQKLVCLDRSGSMRAAMRGPWIPLLAPATPEKAGLLIVPVRLSDSLRAVRLALDSGAAIPFLYRARTYMSLAVLSPPGFGPKATDARGSYTLLPPQDLKIGDSRIHHVSFANLTTSTQSSGPADFEGVLTFGLFRRVLIDHADRQVALEER